MSTGKPNTNLIAAPGGRASHARVKILEFQVQEYFQSCLDLQPGNVVVDVGANIGMFTLEALRRMQGEGTILAVEPVPELANMLRKNVHEFFPSADVRVIEKAISKREGEVIFNYRPLSPETSSLDTAEVPDVDWQRLASSKNFQSSAYSAAIPMSFLKKFPRAFGFIANRLARYTMNREQRLTVSTCPLNTLFESHSLKRVDLLKVDIEGRELEAIETLTEENWRIINQIAVEVHDVDGRVEAVERICKTADFDIIERRQEALFQGSSIYNVFARRL